MVRETFPGPLPGWTRRRIGFFSLVVAVALPACAAASAGTRPDIPAKSPNLDAVVRAVAPCDDATSIRRVAIAYGAAARDAAGIAATLAGAEGAEGVRMRVLADTPAQMSRRVAATVAPASTATRTAGSVAPALAGKPASAPARAVGAVAATAAERCS